MQTRRVLLVDQDELVLRALERLVHRFRPCLRAATVTHAKQEIASGGLCGVIVDSTLETPNDGIEVAKAFRRAYPGAPILLLTSDLRGDTAGAAFDMDAGILAKGTAKSRIDSFALRCVCADNDHLPVVQGVLADWARRTQLTVKEVEVLDGALRDRRSEWHAQNLGLSDSAYRARRTSLLRKLLFSSLDDAVIALQREALRRATVLDVAV